MPMVFFSTIFPYCGVNYKANAKSLEVALLLINIKFGEYLLQFSGRKNGARGPGK
jgi:hypothetical protein